MSNFSRVSAFLLMLTVGGAIACNAGDKPIAAVPSPVVDSAMATSKGEQTAVVAGGCFWGIQAVFQHVKGVINATSGYSGGAANTAEYELVSTGDTGTRRIRENYLRSFADHLWPTAARVFLRRARSH